MCAGPFPGCCWWCRVEDAHRAADESCAGGVAGRFLAACCVPGRLLLLLDPFGLGLIRARTAQEQEHSRAIKDVNQSTHRSNVPCAGQRGLHLGSNCMQWYLQTVPLQLCAKLTQALPQPPCPAQTALWSCKSCCWRCCWSMSRLEAVIARTCWFQGHLLVWDVLLAGLSAFPPMQRQQWVPLAASKTQELHRIPAQPVCSKQSA